MGLIASSRFTYRGVVAFALLVSALASPGTSAVTSELEAHPLRPPDLSSPRDTLQGFIGSMNAVHDALGRNEMDLLTPLRRRVMETLDFSETPRGHTWDERSMRAIYLKEILDRILLPPLDEVPGDAEVAGGTIEHWSIPDTRITISRIPSGERAGEYVFSAGTVANLRRYYRESEHLPYKPGASVGFLEDVEAFNLSHDSIARRIEARLKPVDATSPREVLQQFLASVNGAYAVMVEADDALRATPQTMTRAQAIESERRATAFMDRAVKLLDLSHVPEALRDSLGVERALQIKEVLDRAPLPPIESIPGERQVERMRRSDPDAGPVRWIFPHTELEIIEFTEGSRAGRFGFSARTVADADEYYRRLRELPYRGEGEGDDARKIPGGEEYVSPEISRGIYEFYTSTPGYLIPGASRLGILLSDLPEWLTHTYFGQTLWQWVGLAAVTLIGVLLFSLLYRIGRFTRRRLKSPVADWITLLMPLTGAGVVVVLVEFVRSDLNTSGGVTATALVIGTFLVFLFFAAAAFRFSVALGESAIASPRIAAEGFDASLVRLVSRAIGFVAAVVIAVLGLQRAGADVVPLVAGLGVGGLAVALAVRPTLENMIGGLILFADRPVALGDYCTYGDQSGTVEDIGLRSTRIRGLDRTITTVPNAVLADMKLINWTRCDTMRIKTVIGVRYETTPEQLRRLLAGMRQVCLAHPKIETDTLRVRFTDFGTSSLDITVQVYARTKDWNDYFAIREDLYLRFMDVIEEAGTSVAFPSSTVYLGRDGGLDPDKIAAAEQEVAAWREAGELPFPRTPASLAQRVKDTLDYPPKGSPEAAEKAGAGRWPDPRPLNPKASA